MQKYFESKACKDFEIKNFGQCHDLYLKGDYRFIN